MIPITTAFADTSSLRMALKGLSSENLLALNEVIETIAMERIEEEEVARVKVRERQKVIADFKELLAIESISPEELLAFAKGRISASKRSR